MSFTLTLDPKLGEGRFAGKVVPIHEIATWRRDFEGYYTYGRLTLSERLYDYFRRVYAVVAGDITNINRFHQCLVESYFEAKDTKVQFAGLYDFHHNRQHWQLEVTHGFQGDKDAIKCHAQHVPEDVPIRFILKVIMTQRLFNWMMEFIGTAASNKWKYTTWMEDYNKIMVIPTVFNFG